PVRAPRVPGARLRQGAADRTGPDLRGPRIPAARMVGTRLERPVHRVLQVARRGPHGRVDGLPPRRGRTAQAGTVADPGAAAPGSTSPGQRSGSRSRAVPGRPAGPRHRPALASPARRTPRGPRACSVAVLRETPPSTL